MNTDIKLWKPDEDNNIFIPKVVGYLTHENTHTTINVYKKINWFQALFLKWCFGLKYTKFKK